MKIGSIYADIAGDSRYRQILNVDVTDNVGRVELLEASPVGGMDGPGGANPFRVVTSASVPAVTAKGLMSILRCVLDAADTIKSYGRPSKEFTWRVGNKSWKGLSVAKCQLALDAMNDW